MNASDSVPLEGLTSQMIDIYAGTRRPSTVRKLKHIVGRLLEHLGPGDRPPRASDLTTAGIARLMPLAWPGCSPNTIRGHLGYIRAIASYAVEEGLLDKEPTWRRVMPRRVKAGGVGHLSLRQMAELLDYLRRRSRESWAWHRLFALGAVAGYTGARTSEVLWLRRSDIDLADRIIEIDPHPGRDLKTERSAQPVPVAEELAEILAGWLPRIPDGCPWANPGMRCRMPWTGGRPGHTPVDALKAAGRAVGLSCVTFQVLRRTWATHAESLWGMTEGEIRRVLRNTEDVARLHYRQADRDNLRRIGSRVTYRVAS